MKVSILTEYQFTISNGKIKGFHCLTLCGHILLDPLTVQGEWVGCVHDLGSLSLGA
jgi:hypothetical protein